MKSTKDSWQQRARPPRLERRLEFQSYEATRDFLDAVADVCESAGYYPDISFGRTYVNITIHADEGAEEVGPERVLVARSIDGLMDRAAG